MADKALLVGINTYPGAPLSGCVNDVKDMADYLVAEHGFAPSAIRLLTDNRAKTSAIIDRLAWLAKGAKPGDRLVFHYSGHGAQVATRNSQDEIDGKDEVMCPVDFDWEDKHLIRDKQLHAVFASVPAGVKFVWVADCCHSGSLDRDLAPPAKKGKIVKKAKILGSRFMTPPADLAWRLKAADHLGHVATKLHTKALTNPLSVAFISGCKDAQTSADANFGGRANGALTYFLLKNLKKLKGQSVSAVVQAVRKELAQSGYDQVPQMDGSEIESPFLG